MTCAKKNFEPGLAHPDSVYMDIDTAAKKSAAVPRLLIAGSGSGSGKTTLSCALLLALKILGLTPAAFKCGPDYIDPMFHTRVLGVPSRNLDIFMCGEEAVRQLLVKNSAGRDIAVIEGVMGIYDGLGESAYGSSNHLARLTGTPELLVLDARGESLSLAARLHGYLTFMPNNIKGVIFSRTSAKTYPLHKKMLEEKLGLKVYGYLPPLPEAAFASRRLGLTTPGEIAGIEKKLAALAAACLEHVDIDSLLALARSAPALEYTPHPVERPVNLRLAVARDQAFCFYYEDNFDLLRSLGAELIFFSPLQDTVLPAGVSGLVIGGGYPEEHAHVLAQNRAMLQSIREAADSGMPVWAEGGGFIYLGRDLRGKDGQVLPMCGVLATSSALGDKPENFGYVTLTAKKNVFLCKSGAEARAHEFHYTHSTAPGASFTASKASGASWPCIHASSTKEKRRLFAGYPHFHFWGNNRELAVSFVLACKEYLNVR